MKERRRGRGGEGKEEEGRRGRGGKGEVERRYLDAMFANFPQRHKPQGFVPKQF